MAESKRPEGDTPRMEQRRLRDDRGRIWTGSVTSGTLRGGEQHAEVVFVCEDQPSELKRFSRLEVPPAEADDMWRKMDDSEIHRVFDESEPA